MVRYIVAVLLLMVMAAFTVAQCVNGRCSVPTTEPSWPVTGPVRSPSLAPEMQPPVMQHPVSQPPVFAPRYQWVKVPENSDQEALLEYGKQIGCWSLSGAYYRSLNADGSWGEKENQTPDGYWSRPSPAKTPRPMVGQNPEFNFGMDYTPGEKPRYSLCDGGKSKDITRRRAMALVEGPNASDIPDDSKKFRVTVIGSKEARTKAISDIGEKLSVGTKDQVIVCQYAPDSVLVKKLKLVTDGSPAVTLQAPDGQVLGRNLDGTWDVTRVEAIEEKVKSYDPSKDPDLKVEPKADPSKPLNLSQVPAWGWGLGGLGVLALLLLRKKGD